MLRPILITGATGFLGSHVVAELYKAGLGGRVHLLLRSEPKANSLLGLRFRDSGLSLNEIKDRLYYADFKDQEKFNAVLKNLESISSEWVVIHLAAIINSQGDETAQEQVNFERTKELLNWTNQNGSRFVYTSSIVAFGGSPDDKPRTEADYDNYHAFNKLDGYSRSKRKAHNSILENTKVCTVILCPGIIHGAYEHMKSSRAHLEIILSGKLKWAPGGIGAFVSLGYVGEQIITSALDNRYEKGVHVRLLNDVCLSYLDYFQMYRDCAGKEKINIRSIPSFLVYPIAGIYCLLLMVGIKISMLGKLIQAFLNYNFKIDKSLEAGKSILRAAIIDSIQKRG